jgi:hypothetical protein
MTTIPPMSPAEDEEDPKEAAYTALSDALEAAQAAANNPANTKAARDLAFDAATAISDQMDAVDEAVFTGDTVDLDGSEDAMTEGIAQLKALQEQIAEIGNGMKEGATIISGLDEALSKMSALGL